MKTPLTLGLLTVAVLGLGVPDGKQSKGGASKESTRLEALKERHGSLITIGSCSIGQVEGTGCTLFVSAQDIFSAQDGARAYGIVVMLIDATTHGLPLSYIDDDEIDGLLQALTRFDSLKKADATKLDDLLSMYTTKSGLRVQLSDKFCVTCGSGFAQLPPEALTKFRSLLASAKTRLDAVQKS